MDLKKDIVILNWLDRINAKPNTKKQYKFILKKYCEFLGKSPAVIIEEYLADIKSGKLMPERRIFQDIPAFLSCMQEEKNYAPKTRALFESALVSFFRNHYIETPILKRKGKVKPLAANANEFLAKQDICKLINAVSNPRDKAIILTMATSGMGQNEIRNLKLFNIKIEVDGIGVVKLRREKAEHDYTTFLSPEAVRAIRTYWDVRENILKRKIQPKEYVFVGTTTNQILNNSPVSKRSLELMFNRLGKKLGYSSEGFIPTRSHAMRKFFSNTLKKAGMRKDAIDSLIGHVPSSVDLAYFGEHPEELKKIYISYLPYLTIENNATINPPDAKDSEVMKEQIQLLQDKLAAMEKLIQSREAKQIV